uniref:Uncharacterized protein n=1 Tax=Myoviridae sp. ctiBE32 TaxID=2826685 RepID=A0A8S5N781_9CAUD|nr:MAG TPA: hypothetical protein [Myoviridae sp. ctiBE32]
MTSQRNPRIFKDVCSRHSEEEQDRADEFIEKMTSDFAEKSKNL